jgi:hypothetical protein
MNTWKMAYGFFVTICLAGMILRVMFGHATVDATEEKVLQPLILVFTILARDWAAWAFEKTQNGYRIWPMAAPPASSTVPTPAQVPAPALVPEPMPNSAEVPKV